MSDLTFDAYEQVIRNSGLVEESRLSKVVAEVRNAQPAPPTNPHLLSDRLLHDKLITTWQNSKLMQGFYEGFFLGKYKMLVHLGRGGMSTVYLAEHTLMGHQVALKLLHHFLTEKSSYLERLYLESRACAALNHPNIVRAYDVGCDEGFHYFVMEYVEGLTLQQLVERDGPLPFELAGEYMRQAAEGLHHAHEHGIIHRDIKPANMIVNPDGVLKVLDLGLTRLSSEEAESLTLKYNELMLGTVDYLSPEQALSSHHIDSRADIYSLGCTFYFLLTGQPPFDGSEALRLMKHQTEKAPEITKFRADAPAELVAIIDKSMAKKPDDRYQVAGEMAKALGEWLSTRPGAPRAKIPSHGGIGTSVPDTKLDAGETVPFPPTVPGGSSVDGGETSGGRSSDVTSWTHGDYKAALAANDRNFVRAVDSLIERFPTNDRAAVLVAWLLGSTCADDDGKRTPEQLDPALLNVMLRALGVMKAESATNTLQSIVLGKLKPGCDHAAAVELAVNALAKEPSPDRELFLVNVLTKVETVRPDVVEGYSNLELRLKIASALVRLKSERAKPSLEARLRDPALNPAGRTLAQLLLHPEGSVKEHGT